MSNSQSGRRGTGTVVARIFETFESDRASPSRSGTPPSTPVATTAASPERSPATIPQAIEEISSAVGTRSKELALRLLNQALGTTPEGKDQDPGETLAEVLQALRAFAPMDDLEGMLAGRQAGADLFSRA